MNLYKRIISFIMVFAMAICLCSFTVFADDEYSSQVTSLYDAILSAYNGIGELSELITGESSANEAVGKITADESDNFCSVSGDHYHHGTMLTGQSGYDAFGRYYMLTCSQCGDDFKCYSSDLSDAYDAYVDELPIKEIDGSLPDNLFCWYPAIHVDYRGNGESIGQIDFDDGFSYVYTTLSAVDPTDTLCSFGLSSASNVSYPVTGKYWYFSKGINASNSFKTSHVAGDSFKTIGDVIVGGGFNATVTPLPKQFTSTNGFKFYCQPTTSIANLYTPTTRPDNLELDLTDSTQTINYDNTTIINETTNQYYSITNNANYMISNWKYNYTNRSYELTLENNTPVTVIFADENIVILEGITETTYYYRNTNDVAPSPEPSPSPTPDDDFSFWYKDGSL